MHKEGNLKQLHNLQYHVSLHKNSNSAVLYIFMSVINFINQFIKKYDTISTLFIHGTKFSQLLETS